MHATFHYDNIGLFTVNFDL